ncbi:hypothetical protein [Paraburkholderia sp. CI3]|uniref:hypothetical protein n=1 Tax=Paraburkholderia sp. CI3 TaxID=2991060 RepID=UPI003D25B3B9
MNAPALPQKRVARFSHPSVSDCKTLEVARDADAANRYVLVVGRDNFRLPKDIC